MGFAFVVQKFRSFAFHDVKILRFLTIYINANDTQIKGGTRGTLAILVLGIRTAQLASYASQAAAINISFAISTYVACAHERCAICAGRCGRMIQDLQGVSYVPRRCGHVSIAEVATTHDLDRRAKRVRTGTSTHTYAMSSTAFANARAPGAPSAMQAKALYMVFNTYFCT